MADIEIETSEVEALISEIEGLYADLSTKIKEVNDKKDGISSYWSSREASQFINKLDTVTKMFASFDKEYNRFIVSLNNFVKMYNNEEDSIISSVDNFSTHE